MKATRLFIVLAVLAVSAGVVVSLAVIRSGRLPTEEEPLFQPNPPPTEAERRQMDVLSGQLFVFDGVTNIVRKKRTIDAFDGQHEMVPYLRLLAPYFERYDWPKDRPVRILDQGDRIDVYWPFPPEIENQPTLFRPDCLYYSPIDKKEKKVITFGLGG